MGPPWPVDMQYSSPAATFIRVFELAETLRTHWCPATRFMRVFFIDSYQQGAVNSFQSCGLFHAFNMHSFIDHPQSCVVMGWDLTQLSRGFRLDILGHETDCQGHRVFDIGDVVKFNGLAQNRRISSALAMELPQFCTKPSGNSSELAY